MTKIPSDPRFSSGPCKKYPTFSFNDFDQTLLGRSHRSERGIDFCQTLSKEIGDVLGIPSEYKVALVAGSAMGALATLLWNLVGAREIEALVSDAFSKLWYEDVKEQLKINVTCHDYFKDFSLPTGKDIDSKKDVLLTWNGTSSGVELKKQDWSYEREGLVFCDATSAAFCVDLPWEYLDATAFSFQKGLGSEAAHGIIVLSPKAYERLKTYTPQWGIPKVFRLKTHENIHKGVFEGLTLNTPSLLVLNDMMLALKWAKNIGGLKELLVRTNANYSVIKKWVDSLKGVRFLSDDYQTRISPCLVFEALKTWDDVKVFCKTLEEEGVAFDIKGHKDAPRPCLRIWCGPTIHQEDLISLTKIIKQKLS